MCHRLLKLKGIAVQYNTEPVLLVSVWRAATVHGRGALIMSAVVAPLRFWAFAMCVHDEEKFWENPKNWQHIVRAPTNNNYAGLFNLKS